MGRGEYFPVTYNTSNFGMTRKSDFCSGTPCMNYAENGAGPHQLTSSPGCTGCLLDAGIAAPTFQYDADGNPRLRGDRL